jgi:hypothetical protein
MDGMKTPSIPLLYRALIQAILIFSTGRQNWVVMNLWQCLNSEVHNAVRALYTNKQFQQESASSPNSYVPKN